MARPSDALPPAAPPGKRNPHAADADAHLRARALELRVHDVTASEEPRNEAVARAREDDVRHVALHAAPAVENCDTVAHRQRLFLVVGHVEERGPVSPLDVLELELHLAADLFVQRGQRLVEQQHLRRRRQGARQCHALLFAAAQQGRVLVARRPVPTRSSICVARARRVSADIERFLRP